ncbi:MAG: porin family protein [Bacteroidia bacterium]|jgi:hypothetical protein
MKKIIAVLLVIFFAAKVQAQSIEAGVKAGINVSSLSKAPNLGDANSTTGFVFGGFVRTSAAGFFIQPEILLTQRRGVFTDDSTKLTVTNTLTYLDVPVLFGYKLAVFRFSAGPNFQFLMGANQDAPDILKDPNFSKDNFNAASVGIQVGVGVNLGKINLDARYDGSIGDLGKTITTASGKQVSYSTRANMFQLTIGYRIL